MGHLNSWELNTDNDEIAIYRSKKWIDNDIVYVIDVLAFSFASSFIFGSTAYVLAHDDETQTMVF